MFAEKVYFLVKKIPEGYVSTYGSIAKVLNSKACRAVGNALNKNPYLDVPCHRIISSDGSLGGFAFGSEIKIKLLEKEGLSIKNNKIEDFKKKLWPF